MGGRTIPTRVGRTDWAEKAGLPKTDHPHAGGENANAGVPEYYDSGPSPRGWGERR